jgi:hypothetical protein
MGKKLAVDGPFKGHTTFSSQEGNGGVRKSSVALSRAQMLISRERVQL